MKSLTKSKTIIPPILACILTFIITNLAFPDYSYGQVNSALEKKLAKTFPKNAKTVENERWEYQPEIANINKINKPLVKARIPAYDFYMVRLMNYQGSRFKRVTCVVLFDSVKSKIVLSEAIWFGGISEALVKLYIGQKFGSRDSLLNFLTELNELMQIGSYYRFKLTSFTNDSITYNVVHNNDDNYKASSNVSTAISNDEEGVWREIKIDIKDLTIIQYTATTLVTNEVEIVNKDTQVRKPYY